MQQKYINKTAVAVFFMAAVLFSCKKYSYYQNNPNYPSVAIPSLLLTNICENTFRYNFTENGDGSAFACRYLSFYGGAYTAANYGWAQGGYGNYDILRQVLQMDTLAQAAGQQAYTGLAHFFRAVLYSQLTEQFGDIPYSTSLKAISGNVTPVYDAQEDVYVGVLNELEEANTIMGKVAAQNTNIAGDIIYGGNAMQWQKAINVFKLRLLIHLSKKTADTKLNIAQQFQKIISNPTTYPLMGSIADNAQIVFNTTATADYYPTFDFIPVTTEMSLERGFADTLVAKNDPRLFALAQPISGQTAGVFSHYAGLNAGLTYTDQQNEASMASLVAARYSNSMVNEPLQLVGYAEQEFLIAEAISRGWISAGPGGSIGTTATDCYNNGINGSMQFYNTWASAGITDAAIASYQAQPTVALSSNAATAITQILTQKYIAMFLQSDMEPFVEQRRTGIPTFDVGPGTLNNQMVPKRWLYPTSEYEYNATNVNAAVQSQYGGNDDVNGVMWLLK